MHVSLPLYDIKGQTSKRGDYKYTTLHSMILCSRNLYLYISKKEENGLSK